MYSAGLRHISQSITSSLCFSRARFASFSPLTLVHQTPLYNRFHISSNTVSFSYGSSSFVEKSFPTYISVLLLCAMSVSRPDGFLGSCPRCIQLFNIRFWWPVARICTEIKLRVLKFNFEAFSLLVNTRT